MIHNKSPWDPVTMCCVWSMCISSTKAATRLILNYCINETVLNDMERPIVSSDNAES